MGADLLNEPDAALLSRLDREPDLAMEALVERYTPLICHVAGKYLTDPEDVKECVNDVFAEVYFHRMEFAPSKGSLAAWIGAIARNRAISMYRKQKQALPLPEDGAEAEGTGPDVVAELERAMDVEQAISQLSDANQQIIRMKYYGGMSIAEIAETLQIPYETAKKRHTRSVKQLRRLLLTILVIAALLILAACGAIQLLRHFGFLPGYGVTSDPDASCYLMREGAPTVETAEYTAWIESARLYNGELTLEYRLEAPEQPFETEYNEAGVATTDPLTLGALLCYEDGTPLPGQPGGWITHVTDYFHVRGTAQLTLEQEKLDELRRNGQITLELRVTDLVFDGQEWPDAVIPFTLAEVREQSLEGYPSLYDETTGGFLLDSRVEDGGLVLDVYPISNGAMEFYGGLTLPPGYQVGAEEYGDCEPLTIVGADGTAYTGQPAEGYLSHFESGFVSFSFPDAPPGTYTLKLPYVYMLLKQEGSLTWDLLGGKASDQTVSFPGGSFRTVSITELEEPVPDERLIMGVPVVNTHTWEISVQCQFDKEDITAIQGAYASAPQPRLWAEAMAWARFRLFGESMALGSSSISQGRRDPESGNLIYQLSVDDATVQTCNLSRVECNPAPLEGSLGLMVLRYDHPMELEFEVTP